jgi:hypothetical protein
MRISDKIFKKTQKILKRCHIKNRWVSGSQISNFLLKDPVIDWFDLYYNKYGLNNTRVLRSKKSINCQAQNQTNNQLMKIGISFENKVFEDLMTKYPNDTVFIFNTQKDDINDDSFYFKTLEEINKNTPIILQAVLKSEKLKLRGVIDILVRSDFINKIIKKKVFLEDVNKPYYVIIDVKWTTMSLCVDGKTIRNEGRFCAYKGQLLIYNTILGDIQGYMCPRTYIMAKSWKIDNKESGYCCYDRLGEITYTDIDIDNTVDAINWVRDVREEGNGWCPLFPHITEMCCNSNVNSKWDMVKKEVLKITKDITSVWKLSQEHRNKVFKKGIKRWDDKNCNFKML